MSDIGIGIILSGLIVGVIGLFVKQVHRESGFAVMGIAFVIAVVGAIVQVFQIL